MDDEAAGMMSRQGSYMVPTLSALCNNSRLPDRLRYSGQRPLQSEEYGEATREELPARPCDVACRSRWAPMPVRRLIIMGITRRSWSAWWPSA